MKSVNCLLLLALAACAPDKTAMEARSSGGDRDRISVPPHSLSEVREHSPAMNPGLAADDSASNAQAESKKPTWQSPPADLTENRIDCGTSEKAKFCHPAVGVLATWNQEIPAKVSYCGAVLLSADRVATSVGCLAPDMTISEASLGLRMRMHFPAIGSYSAETLPVSEILSLSAVRPADKDFPFAHDFVILKLEKSVERSPLVLNRDEVSDGLRVRSLRMAYTDTKWSFEEKECQIVERSWHLPSLNSQAPVLGVAGCHDSKFPETRGLPIFDQSGKLLALSKSVMGFSEKDLSKIEVLKFLADPKLLAESTVRDFDLLLVNRARCLALSEERHPDCRRRLSDLKAENSIVSVEQLLRVSVKEARTLLMSQVVKDWAQQTSPDSPLHFVPTFRGDFNPATWQHSFGPKPFCFKSKDEDMRRYKVQAGLATLKKSKSGRVDYFENKSPEVQRSVADRAFLAKSQLNIGKHELEYRFNRHLQIEVSIGKAWENVESVFVHYTPWELQKPMALSANFYFSSESDPGKAMNHRQVIEVKKCFADDLL